MNFILYSERHAFDLSRLIEKPSVARKLNVTPQAVDYYVRSGKLPVALRLRSGRPLFDEDVVDAFNLARMLAHEDVA